MSKKDVVAEETKAVVVAEVGVSQEVLKNEIAVQSQYEVVEKSNIMNDEALGHFYSMVAETKEQKIALYNAINSPDARVGDCINMKIEMKDLLVEIIELADDLPFRSTKDKHELSHLYETKIKNMGNAGRNGGQYYTPRPLIRAMIPATPKPIHSSLFLKNLPEPPSRQISNGSRTIG